MGLTVILLATEGRGEPPRGRLRVTPAGTERQKVGLGWVIIWSIECRKCHTKEGSVTVDVGLVEVDRGESRLLDGGRRRSRGCGVCGGGDRRL